MIERTCKWCEKPMQFELPSDVRKFCSRQCFRAYREKKYTTEDDTSVVMPPLEHITDEGFMALTTAIIHQAKDDIMCNEPGTMLREEAEDFFLSEEFYGMTNLDGFDMLCKIQDKYDEKMRRKEWRKLHVSGNS